MKEINIKKLMESLEALGEESSAEEKADALQRLYDIREEIDMLAGEAADIMQHYFPSEYQQGEAYGAFDMTSSSNQYDTTFSSILNSLDDKGDDYYG